MSKPKTWSVYTRLINSRESRDVGKALRDAGYDISNIECYGKTPLALAEYFFPPVGGSNDPNFERRFEVLRLIVKAAEWIPGQAQNTAFA